MLKREIFFKAKEINSGEWVYGHYYNNCDYGSCQDIIVDLSGVTESGIHYIVDGKTVEQFTGCLDKNGKPIFEGDYAEDGTIVVFCDKCHGWQFGQLDIPTGDIVIPCHKCDGNYWFDEEIEDFEITGNIHDIKK